MKRRRINGNLLKTFHELVTGRKLRKTLRGTRGNERKKVGKEISMRSKSEDRTRNVKKKSQHPSR